MFPNCGVCAFDPPIAPRHTLWRLQPFPGWGRFEGPDSADLDEEARRRIASAAIPVPEGVTKGVVRLADERRFDVPVVLVCPEFTPAQAQEVHGFIRKSLAALFDEGTARRVRIQYGGSVKPANTRELMTQPDVDGALVGGASLEIRSFSDIVKNSI